MNPYYFLFGLGLIWGVFAAVQDFRTREVSNWLNFSLIAFALSYRAFYSIFNSDLIFFLSGLLGFALFFVLAHLFYYGKAFAGGDAKLMMGFGVILPYGTFTELGFLSAVFIFSLFFVGSIWSLLYSVSIVNKNKKKFLKELGQVYGRMRKLIFVLLIVFVLAWFFIEFYLGILFFGFYVFSILLYLYVKSLDACMIKRLSWNDLSEGDWLEEDVVIGGKTIKKSVHGLSLKEIKMIKKSGKKVLIKEGIPFTIAFLLALIVMGYAFLVLKLPLEWSLLF